jgi:hypothetical protein
MLSLDKKAEDNKLTIEKVKMCVKSLRDHPMWTGSVGAFNGYEEGTAFDNLFEFTLKDLNIAPKSNIWIHAFYPNNIRHGPSEFPLPGIPGVHYSLQGDSWYFVFHMTTILSHGLTMASLMEHIESKEGKHFLENSCTLYHIPEGCFVA